MAESKCCSHVLPRKIACSSPVEAGSADIISVPDTFYTRYGKRMLDIIVALVVLVLTLPLNLILAIATYLDVGRPIFFRQQRAGRNGQLFTIVKFRNMTDDKDEAGRLLPAAQRVTRWGGFVRKTSLDELLNFVSILKGDMSLIGPRPLLPEYTERYHRRHKMRLLLRPGLECPPCKRLSRVWTWQEQLDNDVWYVEHVGFLLDCKMFLRLIRFAFDSQYANMRSSVGRGAFRGYSKSGEAVGEGEK